MQDYKLSIVIPCYNEEKNIPLIFQRLIEIVGQRTDIEIVLVNNGSTDNSKAIFTQQLASGYLSSFRVVTITKNIGYGHGIITGLRVAKGEVVAWTHADLQTDPNDIITAYNHLQALTEQQQVIIKGKRIQRSFSQWLLTFGMSCIASVILLKPLYDINAQPKLFHRNLLSKLINPPDDFSLDLYLLCMAKQLGYRIETIPVSFSQRLHGESKWAYNWKSKYKTIFRTIKYIFKLRNLLKQQTIINN